MSTFRINIPAGLSLVLICLANSALAQVNTYCVGTSQQLANALNAGVTLAGTTVIQVQQSGTPYNVKGTPIAGQTGTGSFQTLKLLGGYTDSACASRALDSSKTIIDGGGSPLGFSAYGSVRVEGLTFQNTSVVSSTALADNGTFTFVSNIFVGSRLYMTDFTYVAGLHALNNLVVNSPTYGIEIDGTTGSDDIEVWSNTVVNSNLYGILACLPSPPMFYSRNIGNNIAWGNHGYDIAVVASSANCPQGDLTPQTASVFNNIYGPGMLRASLASGSGGNLTSDPQFIGTGSYRLQSTSPAINAGSASPIYITAVDLDGNPRLVGSAEDIGTYESSVNDVSPNELVVTNTNDDANGGSLRWAIASANATGGSHTIEFNLTGGSCPYVINLLSDLPQITDPYLIINGFSQPGSRQNTLATGDNAVRCVVLNGSGAVNYGPTFVASSPSQFWIQGVAFEGFNGTALNLSGGQGDIVWGNQFGGKMNPGSGGQQLTANAINIWLYGSTTSALIGGTEPSNRNIIAGANGTDPNYGGRGIAIPSFGASNNNSIIGNLIGLDYSESTTSGNNVGVQIETASNIIGGNVIGNNNNGIQVLGAGAQGNKIQQNRIGISDPFCFGYLCFDGSSTPNQAGIYLWQGASLNIIASNTIANNSIFGVELIDGGTYQNPIVANSIYGNALEIDLNGFTFGYNDPASTAPNRGLNYPAISNAYGGTASGLVTGFLFSSNGGYTIDLFSSPTCDASGYGGGENFLGTYDISSISNATPGHNGYVLFSLGIRPTLGASLAGQVITATVSDDTGNTSEFSNCFQYQCDVIFRHGFDTSTGEKCP